MDFGNLNQSVVEGVPWVEELKEYIHSQVDKHLFSWSKVVIELGLSNQSLDEWIGIFKKQIDGRFEDLIDDVTDMKAKVLDEISELLTKNQMYANQLGLETDLQDINANEQLYQVKRDLTERTERLNEMLERRKKDLEKLIKKQKELCNILEKTPYELPLSPLPSKAQIEDVQNYVDTLEQEKFNREEQYLILKDAIGKLSQELEFVPRTDFEREILSETKRCFDITESNMQQLRKCHEDLVRQVKNRKEEIDQHRQRIDELWNILEESMSKRHVFHERHGGYSDETLKALRDEVKRLEDLKKANIKVFVERLREELRNLWNSCYHHNTENQWLSSDLYTEDLLSYHELEVRKWRNFYTKNEKLIKLFKEHQELWNHLLEMENQDTAGPNRYKNRGGQLLKEEKIRNKLSKKIPLLEEKIQQEASNFEDFTGVKFAIFGTPIMEFIENLHAERNENRKIKLSARKQVREQETLTPAKSCLSLFPSSSRMCLTPQTPSVKSKLCKATTTNGKRARLEVKLTSVAQKGFNSVNPERSKTSRRLSQERSKRMKKCRMLFAEFNNKENLNDTNTTNYDAFEKTISSRIDNCRSTLNPDDIQNSAKKVPPINVIPCTPSRTERQTTPSKTDKQGGFKLTRTPSNLKLLF